MDLKGKIITAEDVLKAVKTGEAEAYKTIKVSYPTRSALVESCKDVYVEASVNGIEFMLDGMTITADEDMPEDLVLIEGTDCPLLYLTNFKNTGY